MINVAPGLEDYADLDAPGFEDFGDEDEEDLFKEYDPFNKPLNAELMVLA